MPWRAPHTSTFWGKSPAQVGTAQMAARAAAVAAAAAAWLLVLPERQQAQKLLRIAQLLPAKELGCWATGALSATSRLQASGGSACAGPGLDAHPPFLARGM